MTTFFSRSIRLFLALLTGISLSGACTNFIVTKGASTDGSVYITYNADSFTFWGDLYYSPATRYPAGAMLDVYEWDTGKFLGKIKQVGETYLVVGNMNEYQVSIGETTFGGREELVDSKAIVDYGSLIYLALQRSKTAREAIGVMTSLVKEYGYYSEGESFSVADANEAWILEMIGKGTGNTGALWVARRIPDGYVSAHANQARITQFPLNDPDNCLYAPDVITFARQKGYFTGKDEDFSFSDTYAPLNFGAVRFCEGRVWSLFRRVNKSMEKYVSYIKCESTERMPLFIKPEHKLSTQDVIGLMRDHFEGTEFDMTKGVAAGAYGSPYRARPLTWNYKGTECFNERPISTPQTGFTFVAQMRSFLPREIAGCFWFGVDDSYMTVYVPMYCSIAKAPYNYQQGLASLSKFNWDAAFWVFNSVSNFVYPRYSLVIGDLQKEQQGLEGKFLAQQPVIEKTAAELLKTSRGQAVDYLTSYSSSMATETYNRWKKLNEFLLQKYMDGVSKNEYWQPVNVGYPDEFKGRIVGESGDALKVKKFPGEDETAYADAVREGAKQLEERNYAAAKKSFQAAHDLKPAEELPAKKITDIESIMKAIDDIVKSHESK
jgi:dipeptidase